MKDYNDILFPYAYNILGSTEDAKDIIQDVLVKYLSLNKELIKNDVGYLVKSVINTAINLKNRNRRIRENSIWLPEPVATDTEMTKYDSARIISYSMMVLLENLTPKERAVFILKNVFDYSHREIAGVIGSTQENSRKVFSRARQKIKSADTREVGGHHRSDISEYVVAIQTGNVALVEQMLSREISLYADGGKNIKVVRELTSGRTNTLDLLLYVYNTYQKSLRLKLILMNHQPALLYMNEDRLINCQIFEWKEDKIVNIFSVVDPQKLLHLSRFL